MTWIKSHKFLSVLIVLLAALLAAGAGFVIWAQTTNPVMPEALAALQSDAAVTVQQGDWLTFTPNSGPPLAGVILYPGGKVDQRAYAPYARRLAEAGYLVVVPAMPLHLAVLAPDRAADIIGVHSEIERWAIGGHSLGGAMAANFAARHPGLVQGLFLWASYPTSSDDLSGQDLQVVSVYGTRDGLASPDEVLGAKPLLPQGALFVPIPGGNHGQFGWYGVQAGDMTAQVSRAAQMELTVQATLSMLQALR